MREKEKKHFYAKYIQTLLFFVKLNRLNYADVICRSHSYDKFNDIESLTFLLKYVIKISVLS